MTREELKAKFAKEIGDKELDNVAGGTLSQSTDDLYRLFDINPEAAMNIVENYSTKDPEAFQAAVADAIKQIPGVHEGFTQGRSDRNNLYGYRNKDGFISVTDEGDRKKFWNAIYKDNGLKPIYK